MFSDFLGEVFLVVLGCSRWFLVVPIEFLMALVVFLPIFRSSTGLDVSLEFRSKISTQ